MLDYYVITAGDACGDYETARHHSTLSKMDLSFGTVISVDEVTALWQQASATAGASGPAGAAALAR